MNHLKTSLYVILCALFIAVGSIVPAAAEEQAGAQAQKCTCLEGGKCICGDNCECAKLNKDGGCTCEKCRMGGCKCHGSAQVPACAKLGKECNGGCAKKATAE